MEIINYMRVRVYNVKNSTMRTKKNWQLDTQRVIFYFEIHTNYIFLFSYNFFLISKYMHLSV